MFLVFIYFSRRNCPIAKRRLTTVAGATPDWGGGQLPPLAPCWLRPCDYFKHLKIEITQNLVTARFDFYYLH